MCWVAGQIVEHAAIRDESPVISTLLDALVSFMERESLTRRKRMIERIIERDHERVPEVLLRRLHREWSSAVILSLARGLENAKRAKDGYSQLQKLEKFVRENITQDTISYKDWIAIALPEDPNNKAQVSDYLRRMKALFENPSVSGRVRGLAAMSLGLTHDPRAKEVLLKCLCRMEEDDFVCWCAAEALTEFNEVDLFQTVCDLSTSLEYKNKPRHRARFIYLLRWSDPALSGNMYNTACSMEQLWQLLNDLLNDHYPIVRGYAILSMARMGFRDAREAVQRRLRFEREPLVLEKIADTLGQIGTPELADLLEARMNDRPVREYQFVRSAFRTAIGEIKERFGV